MSEEAKGNPIVVSIINLKGGVGKTTVAASVGEIRRAHEFERTGC